MSNTSASSIGDPRLPKRFWDRVQVDDSSGCWLWTGPLRCGYGKIQGEGRRTWRVHRYAYTRLVGEIPPALVLDHLCRVRHCVNPDHLEPVTDRENLLRGETNAAANAAQTHCHNGHAFDETNTVFSNGGRRRTCRTCRNARWRKRKALRMARAA